MIGVGYRLKFRQTKYKKRPDNRGVHKLCEGIITRLFSQ